MKVRWLLALAVGLLVRPGPASVAEKAKPGVGEAMDSLLAVRQFREVAISPDGRHVAWVESLTGKNGAPSPDSAIYVADLPAPASAPRRISAVSPPRPHAEQDVVWSPDSQRLAFLSDAAEPRQFELYVADLLGGASRQLTHLNGFLADPKWSPDGKAVAFLFIENAPRAAGPLEPMTPDEGVVESHIYEQRLAVLDLASGRLRQLTPPDLYVYEYDWSPDSQQLVLTAAHGNGDDNWYIAWLYTISAETGSMKIMHDPPPGCQIAGPRWSPDGRYIAVISGLMSDEGNTGGDILVVMPAAGGTPVRPYEERRRMKGEIGSILTPEARNLSSGLAASASSLYWLPSSKEILFVCFADGNSGIGRANLDTGKAEILWSGAETLWRVQGASLGLSLAADGLATAVIRSSFDRPPEVWAGPIANWKPVTDANRGAQRSWGKAQSVHWPSGNLNIQGWLLYPFGYDPAKRYPLVVEVHGGPGWAVLPSWFSNASVLSTAGYFVLLPNPRGSFGAGEAFTRANVKDFGYGDFHDILAGVDEVVKDLPVDSGRVGITGWSYGGYMTMWAVTQTNRFRAAVAGAGLSNWQSYYGENDLDQWMIPFFGASVYDDPAIYARSSPINFIKNARTPTLILVGDRDGECPAPQSYEFWHALKTLGVETQLVIYPNEGHDIHDPAHRRDIVERTVAWFDQYLK